jgi:hypothetical protein
LYHKHATPIMKAGGKMGSNLSWIPPNPLLVALCLTSEGFLLNPRARLSFV